MKYEKMLEWMDKYYGLDKLRLYIHQSKIRRNLNKGTLNEWRIGQMYFSIATHDRNGIWSIFVKVDNLKPRRSTVFDWTCGTIEYNLNTEKYTADLISNTDCGNKLIADFIDRI